MDLRTKIGAGCCVVGAMGALGYTMCWREREVECEDGEGIPALSVEESMRVALRDRFDAVKKYAVIINRLEGETLGEQHAQEIESLLEDILRELEKVDGTPLLTVTSDTDRDQVRAVRKEAVTTLKALETRLLKLQQQQQA
eukprot:TRINITY_DN31650_c0_g1_i1.p1 TRINITY_DN31650_c0_g1~~TRINITY_DN31650_c0_g1_i1.p1  ORF type:complete len:141 (+),score=39.08 TRINITY_DN31650_c0_g1_i1:43-465(+)